jgi:predicted transcriptional regulator
MTTEYEYLSDADRETVDALIAECAAKGEMVKMTVADGREFYSYRHPHGYAWGVNSAADGCNVARGVEKR